MAPAPQSRIGKIELYARGPDDLRQAWQECPSEARHFRPDANSWTAHEIVCHCADSETSAATRIRMVVAEPRPTIIGYDQDEWTRVLGYGELEVDLAFTVIAAVRGWTVPLLNSLADHQWELSGQHSESGAYSATDWLDTYSVHLRDHAEQIRSNIRAFTGQQIQDD